MTRLPCWSIEELVTRYSLEPTIRDVIVEGEFDKDVLTQLLEDEEISDVKVYDIGIVDIPPDFLFNMGLTDGNKQRVICLAKILSAECGGAEYRCVVDRDLDGIRVPVEPVENLLWTKYSCIEMYFMKHSFLQSVVLRTARAKIGDWNKYVDSLQSVLRTLSAIRLADKDLGLNMTRPSMVKNLAVAEANLVFDLESYATRLLNSNGKISQKPRFLIAVKECLEVLPIDIRYCGNGHDLVDLLCWSVKTFRGARQFASTTFISCSFTLRAREAKEILSELGYTNTKHVIPKPPAPPSPSPLPA